MPSKCGEKRRQRQRKSEREKDKESSWSSRSPFDVMQSALTKCQRQAKEPKPKALPDSDSGLPCAFKISQAVGLAGCVCFSCFPFPFLVSSFFLLFFLWAFWKVAVVRLIGNVHLWHFVRSPTGTGSGEREAGREQSYLEFRLCSDFPLHLSFII